MITDFLDNKINHAKMYLRFVLGLKSFLKKKITFEESREIVKKGMQQREENFLKILKKGVFEYKKSPYLTLFKLCHCEYNDIAKLVSRQGLEETLKIIKDDGVYIKIEEFKGKKPIVRKGKEFMVREKDFDNPYMSSCYEIRSGGTRSAGTRVMADFDFLSEIATLQGIITDIWNLGNTPHIILRPVFPYGMGMNFMLHLSKFGMYPLAWFSLIDERKVRLSLRSKLGVFYILHMSSIFGAKFPNPEYIDPKDISKVVELVIRLLKEHSECCIFTNVSSAVRVCLAAREKGINLNGLKFRGCGEPLTAAKHKIIDSCGAKYILYYAFTEIGLAGSLCLDPLAIDDIHLFKNFVALISRKREFAGSSIDAFLFTTLLPSAPKILLNVESGDYGEIETRRCGCPYDGLGFYDHIHNVRSFEKLCSNGMTFYGTDIMRIVEEVLPDKFGGSSLDYQLVEEEDSEGITHITIVVSPKLTGVDEDRLIETLLGELRNGGDSQKVMAEVWSRLGAIKVKRDYPKLTPAGKMFPLHILSNKRKI